MTQTNNANEDRNKSRLKAADARMSILLEGVTTVENAANRLISDPLSWLPVDLRIGDLASVLARTTTLPVDTIMRLYCELQRQGAFRADTIHYRTVTLSDNATSLTRAAPRVHRDDD